MLLLVAAAGGLGAATRFVVDSALAARARASWPVGTVVVNVTGSLLLGFVVGLGQTLGEGPLVAVAGTGFLGGYTTFSTACLEALLLARAGRGALALAVAAGLALAAVLAAAAGLALAAACAEFWG